jgi:ABC-type thiamin/hydroxymethylpyrimidine transport system permease subunit
MAEEGRGRRPTSTFELLLLATIAAFVVVGNIALRFPIKVPGHSGIVWMALLVVARAIVDRPGAAALTGLLSALVAVFLGVGDKGALDTFLSYLAAGVAVDAVLSLRGGVRRARSCVVAGAVGNLAKLAVKLSLEIWIGIPTGFALVGRLYPLLTHLLLGAAGGYLGWVVVGALRRAGYFAYLAEKR